MWYLFWKKARKLSALVIPDTAILKEQITMREIVLLYGKNERVWPWKKKRGGHRNTENYIHLLLLPLLFIHKIRSYSTRPVEAFAPFFFAEVEKLESCPVKIIIRRKNVPVKSKIVFKSNWYLLPPSGLQWQTNSFCIGSTLHYPATQGSLLLLLLLFFLPRRRQKHHRRRSRVK